MSFNQLVYQLGKRYSRERANNPAVEYPAFSGELADLLDPAAAQAVSDLHGEYVIAYHDASYSAQHFIRVYIEQGIFEAQGTPGDSGAYNISTGAYPPDHR